MWSRFHGLPHLYTDKFILERFQLADNNTIVLTIPKREAIYSPGGFKELFDQLWIETRTGIIELCRFITTRKSMNKKALQKRQLTAWFGCNMGAAYETRMQMNTLALTYAPPVIHDIISLVKTTVHQTTGQSPNFNQEFLIGNYPKMGMGWHSNDEQCVDTNTVIASCSLGGLAEMSFALKRHYITGKKSSSGGSKADLSIPIYPGALKEEEKQVLKTKYENGEISLDQWQKELNVLVRPLKGPRVSKAFLKFPLPGTGPVMVQQGKSLNDIYVHLVENRSAVRFVHPGRKLKETRERGKVEVDNEGEESEDET